MKIRINWKKTLLVVTDLALAVYLVLAITSWNKPNETDVKCSSVDIDIEDTNENGFLNTAEIKSLLNQRHIYPYGQLVSEIDSRLIEDELLRMPFVKTAQCYVTQDGHASISITQRTPLIRVKARNGADYYIDDAGGIMPNSKYTSDMIIVTGNVNTKFATQYISHLAKTIMADDFWHNQIVQINVLNDLSIEFVPRVGDHIINIGTLPRAKTPGDRAQLIDEYVRKQFHRMEIFYKHAVKYAGWERYSYISLEYKNQIVCIKK